MHLSPAAVLMGAALIAAPMLTGCVSLSRSDTVSTLPADMAANGRIESIQLSRGDIKVTPGFDALFKSHVKTKLDACAHGAMPLRLEARIDRFDKANPVITTVIAGANVLRGEARLIDVASGRVVGVYHIGHTVVGGRLGILQMGQAEEQLSDAFGSELCKQAFAPAAATAVP
ncbi:hypothetical protein BH11PSE2_BH11PSE2_17070 [soil metagenome]